MQNHNSEVSLFLAGDVMTGRGIDQILQHPVPPRLYESYVNDARMYVELAEEQSGPIPRSVQPDYIWGFALDEFAQRQPDIRLVNLETAITTSEDYWPSKGIHYRMNPRNVDCLSVAGIDGCFLANNHVLDWGYEGLDETFGALTHAGVLFVGAGHHLEEAHKPLVFQPCKSSPVQIFSCGSPSSGIPEAWAATKKRPGVFLTDEHIALGAARLIQTIENYVRDPGLVIVSIHWGGNWGYTISADQQRFAHALIDWGADLVFGHSSHHFKGIEVYRGKLIIYGAGDLITDYEGISGHERYRGDLGLLYFARLNFETGAIKQLALVPTRMNRFQLTRPSEVDSKWIMDVLNREGQQFGTSVTHPSDTAFGLQWT